jgi:nitrogen fixation NifU-like protein
MNAANIHETDELRDLYRELILDHARKPRHFGRLDATTHTARGINPLCGDQLRLFLQLDAEQRIADASFEGSGCAISVAWRRC